MAFHGPEQLTGQLRSIIENQVNLRIAELRRTHFDTKSAIIGRPLTTYWHSSVFNRPKAGSNLTNSWIHILFARSRGGHVKIEYRLSRGSPLNNLLAGSYHHIGWDFSYNACSCPCSLQYGLASDGR